MLLRSIALFALISLAVLSLACPKPAPTPPANPANTQPPATQNNPSPDTSGNGATQTLPPGSNPPISSDSTGSTNTTAGALPQEWPASVVLMPAFSVVTSNVSRPATSLIIVLAARGDVAIDDAQAFYSTIEGWEKDERVPWQTTGEKRTMKYTRGSETLSISLKADNGQSLLEMMYSKSNEPTTAG
jgi:hypothetical protein